MPDNHAMMSRAQAFVKADPRSRPVTLFMGITRASHGTSCLLLALTFIRCPPVELRNVSGASSRPRSLAALDRALSWAEVYGFRV